MPSKTGTLWHGKRNFISTDTDAAGQPGAASGLFTVTDLADGAITNQKFLDSMQAPNEGHFPINTIDQALGTINDRSGFDAWRVKRRVFECVAGALTACERQQRRRHCVFHAGHCFDGNSRSRLHGHGICCAAGFQRDDGRSRRCHAGTRSCVFGDHIVRWADRHSDN